MTRSHLIAAAYGPASRGQYHRPLRLVWASILVVTGSWSFTLKELVNELLTLISVSRRSCVHDYLSE